MNDNRALYDNLIKLTCLKGLNSQTYYTSTALMVTLRLREELILMFNPNISKNTICYILNWRIGTKPCVRFYIDNSLENKCIRIHASKASIRQIVLTSRLAFISIVSVTDYVM